MIIIGYSDEQDVKSYIEIRAVSRNSSYTEVDGTAVLVERPPYMLWDARTFLELDDFNIICIFCLVAEIQVR